MDELFTMSGSQSMVAFPIRAVYRVIDSPSPYPQILISVPKRYFKHAVDRNRVKRQIREAYRCHKDIVLPTLTDNRQLLIAFIWLSPDHRSTRDVGQRIVTLLQRIAEKQNHS